MANLIAFSILLAFWLFIKTKEAYQYYQYKKQVTAELNRLLLTNRISRPA